MTQLARLGIVLLLPFPAAAQEVMAPGDFEAMAEGRTLHFTYEGAPYGEEQYLLRRRSLWRAADGSCADGGWWEDGDAICFSYEGQTDVQCWRFLKRAEGIAAELIEGGSGTGFVVEMSRSDTAPVACPGPRVGS